jgi:hypothetical protein
MIFQSERIFSTEPDGFIPGFAHSIYQKNEWGSQPLDRRDKSDSVRLLAIGRQFSGHRHDEKKLDEYRRAFRKKQNFQTALDECKALLSFLGSGEGKRITYQPKVNKAQFGQREYWHLANHWPKSASPAAYRVRAELFIIIGGDIFVRPKLVKNYLTFFPEDLDFQRMKIATRLSFHPAWTKLDRPEVKSLAVEANELFKRDPRPITLQVNYQCAYLLAETTREAKDIEQAKALGKLLIEKSKGDLMDERDTPSIIRALNKLNPK